MDTEETLNLRVEWNKHRPIRPFVFIVNDYRTRVGTWVTVPQHCIFKVLDERVDVDGRKVLCVPNGCSDGLYLSSWPKDDFIEGEAYFYGNAEYQDEDGDQQIYAVDSWSRADLV